MKPQINLAVNTVVVFTRKTSSFSEMGKIARINKLSYTILDGNGVETFIDKSLCKEVNMDAIERMVG